MSSNEDDVDLDKMAGPSATPAVEALSAGRSRRSTAGNRMRELLEQERERMTAEEEDPSLSISRKGQNVDKDSNSKKKKNNSGKSENEDEDAIFQNEDDDVDFQELEGGEDIIDSDFDLSSDQGDNDEEEGERALEAEEKAAKRASKAKLKAIPMQTKRTALPPKSALAADGEEGEMSARPAKQKKRISFASSTINGDNATDKRNQRSSKRKSAIQFSESVQARLKEDEERRARQMEHAQPKRKKVRLSQADLIAEALEMEEQNRQSLKVFLEREEDRRERERKRGKKKMEGAFIRWRSVTVQYGDEINTKQHPHPRIEEIETSSSANVTQDPVFAARQAAIEEGEARRAAEDRARGIVRENAEVKDGESTQRKEAESVTLVEKTDDTQDSMNLDVADEREAKEEGRSAAGNEADSDTEIPAHISLVVEDSKVLALPPNEKDIASQQNGEKTEESSQHLVESKEDADVVVLKTEKEARAFLSLHELPSSTHWTTMFSHILGNHVDWSRYPYVNPRNRPLRPRISVCPITGLPAKYRDPRSGIPFANREAFANLTAIIKGEFRWSGNGIGAENVPDESNKQSGYTSKASSKKAEQPKKLPRYDPMEMGCFLDKIAEPGANNVRLRAEEGTATINDANRVAQNANVTLGYIPVNALAPGDEQALVAAALALPAGTTRSGGRRSAAK